MRFDSYFICATPRTGSSLLCGLLASTGVAGHPESYFRAEDEAGWAHQWGLARSGEDFDYGEFVRRARSVGTTENGVFAARIMWGTLDEVVDKLAPVSGTQRNDSGLDVLQEAFGDLRFVSLRRANVVAQAVSWSRAEQSGVWHRMSDSASPEPTEHTASFDRSDIEHRLAEIDAHNAAWRAWFAAAGVEPYELRYEDLDRDPVGTTRDVVDFLGLALDPERVIEARHERVSDHVNADWIERFRHGT